MPSLRRLTMLSAMVLAMTIVPASEAIADDDDDGYGAWIATGSCDDIESASSIDDIGDLEREPDIARMLDLTGVDASSVHGEDEGIEVSLDDLTTSPHIIVVRATEDRTSDVLLCGTISGTTDSSGRLTITLDTIDESGLTGVARLQPADAADDDDDLTKVIVAVWEGTGTPVASTPASS